MLVGVDGFAGDVVADSHGGQALRGFVILLAVGLLLALFKCFLIDAEEPVELNHRTGGAQGIVLRFVAQHDGDLIVHGHFHLAGDHAFPDEIVEARQFVVQFAGDGIGLAAEIGWANRLVRFLRVFNFGFEDARRVRHVVRAVILRDQRAGVGNRVDRDGDPVGTHIGDVALLIEFLCDLHGALGAETQLARGFHLQGRGRKRCVRCAA